MTAIVPDETFSQRFILKLLKLHFSETYHVTFCISGMKLRNRMYREMVI